MTPVSGLTIGAPGLYIAPPETPIRALTGVRLDVCAFAGVAPRGPARVPADPATGRRSRRTVATAVESFDEYRRLFGGFEGPGLLPYAVASFFEQGGQRAYVARIVHDYARDGDPAADAARVAGGDVPGLMSGAMPLRLRARSEGSWGNRVRVSAGFSTRQLRFDASGTSLSGVDLPPGTTVPAGTLLRLRSSFGREFRFVALALDSSVPPAYTPFVRVTFDRPATAFPVGIDIVDATLRADDGEGRSERHEGVGLSPLHPRWIAGVLNAESALLHPDASWSAASFSPLDPTLDPGSCPPVVFQGGADRYRDITADDFFDSRWTPGDEEPGDGIHAIAQLPDVTALAVPDLYHPFPLAERRRLPRIRSLAGATFAACVDLPIEEEPAEEPAEELAQLRLEPTIPDDLARITALQAQVVAFAEVLRSFVALLDVPPRLPLRRLTSWRTHFQSSYAAAFHPWLSTVRSDDGRNALVPLPPSGPAAGIIAFVENTSGVPHGPANVIAAGVVAVRETVAPAVHGELHPLGINVYLAERDGVRLAAARTLSGDPDYRQLSVRRLLILLRRTVEQQMQWVVFEPNTPALRAELRQTLTVFLRQLYTAGAFRGATEDESFFVRCDASNNPPRLADRGQLVVEVGVAPSEPVEFIVLRLTRDADGSLTTNETNA
jgi:hypothetical protein